VGPTRGLAAAKESGDTGLVPAVQGAGTDHSAERTEARAWAVRHRTEFLPIDRVEPSGTNPKSRSDAKAVAELTESIRQHGVLQPILVRPAGDGWKVVCGERRLAAANAAGLKLIPGIVHDITEVEALEIQLVENVQRKDLHPLEEAEGYKRLVAAGYDVARIAERTGRSVGYVYDRMKLVNLSQRAKNLFLDEVLTAGHAILLAREKPMDQDRALKVGACIHEERLLFRPEGPGGDQLKEKAPEGGTLLRAVSVRELASWIDREVRFDGANPDALLFPETALTLEGARETKAKIVAITYLYHVPDHAREGKTYCRMSWKRADGKEGSKACKRSVTGFVAVGPRRGEAFEACIDKDRCEVHWAKQLKAKQRRAAAKEAGERAAGKSPEPKAPRKSSFEVQEEHRRERERKAKAAWDEISDRVINASIEKLRTVPAGSQGPLGKILISEVMGSFRRRPPKGALPEGRTAEDLVRHLASIVALDQLTQINAPTYGAEMARKLGVDLAELRKRAKKAAAGEGAKPAKKANRGKRGAR